MKYGVTLIAALILLLATAPMAAAQDELNCEAIQGTEICIESVDLSKNTVEEGNNAQLILAVKNIGNETGDAEVLLGIHQPAGHYTFQHAETISNVEPGESQPVTIPLRFYKDQPVGVHEINVMLFDDSQQHLYDASGYYHKVTVTKDSFNPVQWFIGLGKIAHAALALIALGIFVVTRKFVWG